ncbi:MAG: MarR family winged helix-turn-helix transcriptional regulator [Beijerinckiaceae bacterium]
MQDAKMDQSGKVTGQQAGAVEAIRPLPWEMPRFRNWIAVGKVNMLVERALNRGLAPLGLKCAQLDVLAAIHRFPGLTQQELADKLLVGRSNMSMLLPDLMRRGLIARLGDARDARVRRLHLTESGDGLAREAFAVQTGVIEAMMGALSPEECDALGDMMRRIGRHMVDRDIGG